MMSRKCCFRKNHFKDFDKDIVWKREREDVLNQIFILMHDAKHFSKYYSLWKGFTLLVI